MLPTMQHFATLCNTSNSNSKATPKLQSTSKIWTLVIKAAEAKIICFWNKVRRESRAFGNVVLGKERGHKGEEEDKGCPING